MKIGLFFGSFNPIHKGHVAIATYMLAHTLLKQIWLVVSPHNPLKDKDSLADKQERFKQVQKALKRFSKIKASNIEFSLPEPSYTISTLKELRKKYPQHEFVIIMGEDSLCTLPKWKNYKAIIKNFPIYVYPRKSNGAANALPSFAHEHPSIHLFKAPLLPVSSTLIREQLKKGKDVKKLLA
jgi:nicotinate-nucleotide adenylyltransferase